MTECNLLATRPDALLLRGDAARRPSPAASLAGSPLADRFCFWRGRSGRRYVFSIYRIAGAGDLGDLPRYGDAVVIAADRDPTGMRRIVRIGQTGSIPELAIDVEGGFASGPAGEIHYHLLAGDDADRDAVIRDLM